MTSQAFPARGQKFGRKFSKFLVAVVAFLILVPLQAATSTHHFDIAFSSPVAMAGHEIKITITAQDSKNKSLRHASHTLLVSFTTFTGTDTREIEMKRGMVEINMTFPDAESRIIHVAEKSNPRLSSDKVLKVKSNEEVRP